MRDESRNLSARSRGGSPNVVNLGSGLAGIGSLIVLVMGLRARAWRGQSREVASGHVHREKKGFALPLAAAELQMIELVDECKTWYLLLLCVGCYSVTFFAVEISHESCCSCSLF